jgi:hypothetical protein
MTTLHRIQENTANVGNIISRIELHKSSFMLRVIELFNNKL